MAEFFIAPNGNTILTKQPYTVSESRGVITLIVFSSISALAVVGLLGALSISALNTRSSNNPNLFVRSHVVTYFVSLLMCDLLQAIGSIMTAAWAKSMSVDAGTLCTAQGIIKHVADVGIALWSLVIAFHVFGILFFRLPLKRYALWCTLIGTWSLIATLVITGPATLDTVHRGPFYGISGQWCWITPEYGVQHITLDYMIMFISAVISFVLYTLVYLRLRGNVVVHGIHIRFRMRRASLSWQGSEQGIQDEHIMVIARQMLLYPIAYTIIILPIAAARFSDWFGHDVPFGVTVFCDTIYLLSGTTNVVLFSITRRILPPRSIIPKFLISKPKLVESTAVMSSDADPYYGSYASGNLGLEMGRGGTEIPFEFHNSVGVSGRGIVGEEVTEKHEPGVSTPAWRLSAGSGLDVDLDAVVLTEAGILKRVYSPDADSDSDADVRSVPDASDFVDVDVLGGPLRHAAPLPQVPRSPRIYDEDDGSERSVRRASATPTTFISF